MIDPPAMLDGASVLRVADLGQMTTSGRTLHLVAGQRIDEPNALAIAKYEDGEGVYLFYCDRDWNVLADTFHETEEAAMEQARFEFDKIAFRQRRAIGPE